jgi:hypothetical protein
MRPPGRTPADPGKSSHLLVAPAMERFNASDSTRVHGRRFAPHRPRGRWRVIVSQSLARELNGGVDNADAGQHGYVWPLLKRRFRVGTVSSPAKASTAAEAHFFGYNVSMGSGGRNMWLEDHFGNGSMLQRNERVKLAASFWNNIGAAMVIGGIAAAFFLDKPQGAWTKIGIAISGLLLGWLCYSIASNILTYMHTAPDERH